jgi:Ni/Co efflux regulator RcnB
MKKALMLAIAALAFSTAVMAQDSTRNRKSSTQKQPPKTSNKAGKRADSGRWNRGNNSDSTMMNNRNRGRRNMQDSGRMNKNGKMIPDSGVISTTPY